MIYLAIADIFLLIAAGVMIYLLYLEPGKTAKAVGDEFKKYVNPPREDAEHLSVDGIMDILRVEGYVPERVDEYVVSFKKEGTLYRVSYNSNRMDFYMSFNMERLSQDEETRVRTICRQVSDSIIMAEAVLDGPDKEGEFTLHFRISLMLACRAEFKASVSEYIDILNELHERFLNAYNDEEGKTDGDAAEDAPDPAAFPVTPSSRKVFS